MDSDGHSHVIDCWKGILMLISAVGIFMSDIAELCIDRMDFCRIRAPKYD